MTATTRRIPPPLFNLDSPTNLALCRDMLKSMGAFLEQMQRALDGDQAPPPTLRVLNGTSKRRTKPRAKLTLTRGGLDDQGGASDGGCQPPLT